jgi:hypothetical protein
MGVSDHFFLMVNGGWDSPREFSFKIWLKSRMSFMHRGHGAEGGLHSSGLSKINAPGVSISTKTVLHTLSLEDSIANTNSHKSAKARALAVEDDSITVLPKVSTAESGEGGSRAASDHTGECMELIHIRCRTDGP